MQLRRLSPGRCHPTAHAPSWLSTAFECVQSTNLGRVSSALSETLCAAPATKLIVSLGVAGCRIRLQNSSNCPIVDLWHHYAEQNDARQQSARHVESISTIACRPHREPFRIMKQAMRFCLFASPLLTSTSPPPPAGLVLGSVVELRNVRIPDGWMNGPHGQDEDHVSLLYTFRTGPYQ